MPMKIPTGVRSKIIFEIITWKIRQAVLCEALTPPSHPARGKATSTYRKDRMIAPIKSE